MMMQQYGILCVIYENKLQIVIVLGVWFAYDDEHLIDKISDTFEYCIKSISF